MRRCFDASEDVFFLLTRVSAFQVSSLHLVRGLATKARETADEDRQAIRSLDTLLKTGKKPGTLGILRALKACGNLKDIRSGEKIHSYLTGIGERDVTVANTVVHMYAKCGRMVEAREVFDELPHRTVVSWNALIFGYAMNGEPEEALELYRRLEGESFELNIVTLIAGLKACSCWAAQLETEDDAVKRHLLRRGVDIHSQAAKAGYDRNFRVATSLVDMYSKCGDMAAAREAFDRMLHPCLVSWNSIIHGYATNGGGDQALELYGRMQEKGFKPDAITYVAVLKACASSAVGEEGTRLVGSIVKLEWLERGMGIHSRVVAAGEEFNTKVANSLVNMYIKCGSLLDARRVFDRMSQRSVVTWNSLIFGYSESGDPQVALELLSRMGDEGLAPDSLTFIAALKSCGEIAAGNESKKKWCLEKGRELHSELTRLGLGSGLKLPNSLLDMYAKCGSMSEAWEVFSRMKTHDAVSWNSLIMGYAQGGEPETAMFSFNLMQLEGVTPDPLTFIAALKACGSLGLLQTGRELGDEFQSFGFHKELNAVNSLIDFYGKCGSMNEAQALFDSMIVRRDLVSWNSLIGGYSQQANTEMVFQLFDRMREQERIEPNDITFLNLLKACSHAGLVDKGKECFEMLLETGKKKWGISVNLEHYTCVVDMLGRANRLDEALELLKQMPFEADETIWTSILSSSRKWKNVEAARVAYEEILKLEREDKVSAAYLLMAYALMGSRSNEDEGGGKT